MGLLDRFGDESDDGEEADTLDASEGGSADGFDFDVDDGGTDGLGLDGDDGLGLDGDDGLAFDDGLDGEGSGVHDLGNRVDEMESELASVSSTVGTVRSENEEIANSIEEVEEHVRKLLDIYEMVTRGVNPFVDDVGGSNAFDGAGGGLGLFDNDGQESTEEEAIDDDVASAEAESFFDEEALDEDVAEDSDPDDLFAEEDEMETPDDAEDAKSFDELKAEYEEGADWAEEDPEGSDETGETDAEGEGEDLEKLFEDVPEDPDGTPDGDAESVAVGMAGSEGVSEADPTAAKASSTDGLVNGLDEKPYLETVPPGYVGDLVVLEWLEYMVECADAADAARALSYYETIDWIAPPAAEHLRAFLTGFGEFDPDEETGPPRKLSMDEHVTSLRFIGQLGGSATDATTISRWTGASDDDPAVEAVDAVADTVEAIGVRESDAELNGVASETNGI